MNEGKKEFEKFFDDVKNETRKRLNELGENSIQASKEAAKKLDDYSYKKPRVVVAVFSVFAAIIGFILGRGSKR